MKAWAVEGLSSDRSPIYRRKMRPAYRAAGEFIATGMERRRNNTLSAKNIPEAVLAHPVRASGSQHGSGRAQRRLLGSVPASEQGIRLFQHVILLVHQQPGFHLSNVRGTDARVPNARISPTCTSLPGAGATCNCWSIIPALDPSADSCAPFAIAGHGLQQGRRQGAVALAESSTTARSASGTDWTIAISSALGS